MKLALAEPDEVSPNYKYGKFSIKHTERIRFA